MSPTCGAAEFSLSVRLCYAIHPWQPRGLQRWHHIPKQKHRRSDMKGHHESILEEHTKLFTTFFFSCLFFFTGVADY